MDRQFLSRKFFPSFRIGLATLLVAIVLASFPTVTFARDYDPNAPIEPELITDAESGDINANYLLGYKLFQLGDSDSLEQSLVHLEIAKDGFADAGDIGRSGLSAILKLIGDVHLARSEFAQARTVVSGSLTVTVLSEKNAPGFTLAGLPSTRYWNSRPPGNPVRPATRPASRRISTSPRVRRRRIELLRNLSFTESYHY